MNDRRTEPSSRRTDCTDGKPTTPENHVPKSAPPTPPTMPTNGVLDRRCGADRRDMAALARAERDDGEIDLTGLERRRGPGRRRTDFMKAAEEGEMTPEQFHFIAAVEAFKKSNAKMFPTWTDVLEVVRLMGYRKTMPSELALRNVEDWKEKPDAPSGVRAKPGHPEERRRAA